MGELARAMGPLVGEESFPGPDFASREALRKFVPRHSNSDYHACCSMKMGPRSASGAVDTKGKVHGLEGVRVVDLSVAVKSPRANTNMPALVIALRLADE